MLALRRTRDSALKLVGPYKDSFSSAALASLVIAGIILVSLLADADTGPFSGPALKSHVRSSIIFSLVFAAGGLFGVLFSNVGKSGLREGASCFWVSIRDSTILIATAAFLVFALVIWWFSAWANGDPGHGRHLIQHDPGGIFAAFMGFVTIVGFAFTLHDLRELRRRITTFPDLIDRLSFMLNEVDGDDVVRVLAYTPALGYIALEDSEFQSFYATLLRRKKNGKPCAEIVCLNEKDLADWHNLFIGRRTRRKKLDKEDHPGTQPVPLQIRDGEVNEKLAAAATKKGEQILKHLIDDDVLDPAEPQIKRLPFEFLPGYYFFLTADRAIVVAPLQLPFPKGAPKRTQKNLRGTVQMLGFETNDRAIIRDLSDLYETYQSLPSSYVAECTEDVLATNLETWCNNPQNTTRAMQTLIQQFTAASNERAARSAAEITRNKDYCKFLTEEDGKLKPANLEVTFRVALKEGAHD